MQVNLTALFFSNIKYNVYFIHILYWFIPELFSIVIIDEITTTKKQFL